MILSKTKHCVQAVRRHWARLAHKLICGYARTSGRIRGRTSDRRILIVTDSRGLNLTSKCVLTFPEYLSFIYNAELHLYPWKWTTYADVYRLLTTVDRSSYDQIIINVGISDFSPRPKSAALGRIYQEKKIYYDALFGEAEMKAHFAGDLGVIYEGEETITMFSREMMRKSLVPWLRSMKNLIHVIGNPILSDWTGDYYRKRPANVELANLFMADQARELSSVISCMGWSRAEVMEYTTDSVHLNRRGHRFIYKQIVSLLG